MFMHENQTYIHILLIDTRRLTALPALQDLPDIFTSLLFDLLLIVTVLVLAHTEFYCQPQTQGIYRAETYGQPLSI